MNMRLIARLSIAPLIIGVAGAVVTSILADFASAKGFAVGAGLVALAVLVSGGFFVRVRSANAMLVLIRLALSSTLKWVILMGGAWVALAQGGLPPAAFTCGVIAGLVSTLFNTVQSSTGASTS